MKRICVLLHILAGWLCVWFCERICVCVRWCLGVCGWGIEIGMRWRGAFTLKSVSICSSGPNCSCMRRRTKKGRKATVLIPCLRVISVTLKDCHQHAQDYCHVNSGTWLDSPLMNVIYSFKRGLIIDRGPLSPPTGSVSQLAAKGWLLTFLFLNTSICRHMFLRQKNPPNYLSVSFGRKQEKETDIRIMPQPRWCAQGLRWMLVLDIVVKVGEKRELCYFESSLPISK